MLFTDDDEVDEKLERLGVVPEDHNTTEGIIIINTYQICAYNEMSNGNTLVRMANGDAYELPIASDEFEKLLAGVENIVDLTKIRAN